MTVYGIESPELRVSPAGRDGKRHWLICWYKPNYNDAQTLFSSAQGGFARLLQGFVPGPNAKCVLTRITCMHDAGTAGVVDCYHSWLIYLSGNLTSSPYVFGPHWRADEPIGHINVWDCEIAFDPYGHHVARLYSDGHAATDDIFVQFQGWFETTDPRATIPQAVSVEGYRWPLTRR